MPLQIGPYQIESPILLAPMAGVTDFPMRSISRQLGAGLTFGEMLTADSRLWHSRKSSTRLPLEQEPLPRAVQIAGYCPEMIAESARRCADMGAGLIDINMGCPAKKVCKKDAGSALMRDPQLVAKILDATVKAVDVPVSLKIRTGWDTQNRNAEEIAQIAEASGIQALTVHGRTRACRFSGHAEYQTITRVVHATKLPVIANGDITTAEKAKEVLAITGAAGLMIGRAAFGNPWIFQQITAHLSGRKIARAPAHGEICEVMQRHLALAHEFYPEQQATRLMRKHMGWYMQTAGMPSDFSANFNRLATKLDQMRFVASLFSWNQHEEAA